jgi:hypothetical protein
MTTRRIIVLAAVIVCLAGFGFAQDEDLPLTNWSAPLFWNPAVHPRAEAELSGGMLAHAQGMQAESESLPSSPLPFVAIAPCRIVDTRTAVSDGFHQPNFIDDESRTFPFPTSSDCPGLPSTAGAWSVNIQFRPMSQLSYLTAYPTGTTMPTVSTLTAGPSAWVGNAAIVPTGTSGAIDIYCQYAGRVVIDINGYYGPSSVVTSLNTKTGDVALAEGSNVTITPSGNTLTIAATGGPGGVLPTGTTGQTLYHNGSAWTASSALTNNGSSNVGVNGALDLPATTSGSAGVIRIGGQSFLHVYAGPGSQGQNTFVGQNAGSFTMGCAPDCGFYSYYGSYNTASGFYSLSHNTTGFDNTASGAYSLSSNTTGQTNTASGYYSLYSNTTGNANSASGSQSLYFNTTGYNNTASGSNSLYFNTSGYENTASGFVSLANNTTGYENTASGSYTLSANTTGNFNIALGHQAGYFLTTGSYNIDIGNEGVADEGNTIRIGMPYSAGSGQNRTFIAGIYGVTPASLVTRVVIIDENGQLGTQEVVPAASQTAAAGALPAALLSELQRQQATIRAQQDQIEALTRRLAALEERLSRRP